MTKFIGASSSEYLPPNTLVQLTFVEEDSLLYVGWFSSAFSSNMAALVPKLTSGAGVIPTTASNAVSGDRAATIDAVVKAGQSAATSVRAIEKILPVGIALDVFNVKRRAVDLNTASGGGYSSTSAAAIQGREDATTEAADRAKSTSFLKEAGDVISNLTTTVKYASVAALLLFVYLKSEK